MTALRPGLWTWTAMHPDFGEDVRSYAGTPAARLVLFDPIAPLPDDLPAKERVVCLTSVWHKRGRPSSATASCRRARSPSRCPRTYDEERALWLEPLRALGARADPRGSAVTQADVRGCARGSSGRSSSCCDAPVRPRGLERLLAP